jgi:protein SCO1/2
MIVRFLTAVAFGITLLVIKLSVSDAAVGQSYTTDAFDPVAALAFSQGAIGRQIGDHHFLDRNRQSVRLADFRGQPLVISLIFTSCNHTCPLLTQHLADAVEAAQDALGNDSFQTVTIGFDPVADTPERLSDYAQTQGIELPNWRFLSGDAETLDALIADLGFIRVESPRGFDHLAQTSLIDPAGKVYQQVYGDSFGVTAVVEPLKAILFNKAVHPFDITDIVQRVRLFCTFYDPKTERYGFDYSIFISIAVGLVTLLGLGAILISSWRRSRKTPLGGV